MTTMIVWHMVTVDENDDMGIFASLENAQKGWDESFCGEPVETTWAQWNEETWKGSIEGEVVVEILRRNVY